MTHEANLNLPAIRSRAYAAIDGQVQIAHDIDCPCDPSRWLAFATADHPNADNNAVSLQHASRDILVLLAEVERLGDDE